MNNDILRMAIEAGFEHDPADGNNIYFSDGHWTKELTRFAALVAAAEREACAKLAEIAEPYQAADLIRARSNP